MLTLNRRTFVQLSCGAALGAASRQVSGLVDAPSIFTQPGAVRVTGSNYSWEYSQKDDTFKLLDSKNRLIVSGRMQPAVVVAPASEPALRQCSLGKPSAPRSENGRVTVAYEGVNGTGRLSVTWRFDEHGIWTEPVVYEAPADQDVVSLHYFSDVKDGKPVPSLHASFLVIPGISESGYGQSYRARRCLAQRECLAGPGQLFARSFAAVGLAGALLLRLQYRRFRGMAERLYHG